MGVDLTVQSAVIRQREAGLVYLVGYAIKKPRITL